MSNEVQPGFNYRSNNSMTTVTPEPQPGPIAPIDQMPVVITQPAPPQPPQPAARKIIGRTMMGGRLVPIYERQ